MLIYGVGTGVLIHAGFLSGGPVWLFIIPIIASLLLGPKAALGAVLINAGLLSLIGFVASRQGVGAGLPFFSSRESAFAALGNYLLLNAAEALEDCDPKTVTVSTEAEDNEVVIAVSDTGPGIPEEVQKRLMEPFFTTKETGTGLGLFSCHRIVEEEHGGSLEIDSRPGAGTTIRLRLPAPAAGGQEEG